MSPGVSSSTNKGIAIVGSFLAGVLSAVVVRWIFDQRRPKRNNNQNHDVSSISTGVNFPKHFRQEQLSRHELYFGLDNLNFIKSAKVAVIGLGGVGSHCALMLARGGVEYLRLVDFDLVTLSSLNRHACATLKDVGIPKIECVKNVCLDLGLDTKSIDTRMEMFNSYTGPELLKLQNATEKWDFVLDCIDDVATKASLLTYCIRNKIRVISCMGAGGKSDMTRLHVSDLRTSAKDPLASKLRQTMKRYMKNDPVDKDNEASYMDDMERLTIIYSSEKPVAKLVDLTEEQKAEKDKSQFGQVDGMRIRVLPVLGPLPAIMGQSIAALVLCELGKKPIRQPVTGERIGKNVRHKVYQHLVNRENKIKTGELVLADGVPTFSGPVQIDIDDVDYLYGIWRNKCAITGARLGTTLSLVRWDTSKPADTTNLVLMSAHALKSCDELGKSSIKAYIRESIENRLALCRDLNCDM